MRHAVPHDVEWIDDVLDRWPVSLRWDVRGWTPSRHDLVSRLWDGVVTQRVVLDNGSPAGLLQLVDVDERNGSGRIDVVVRDETTIGDPMRVFVGDVFRSVRLRVIHVHATVDALDVDTLLSGTSEVGRLRERQFRGRGRYADVAIHELRCEAVASR